MLSLVRRIEMTVYLLSFLFAKNISSTTDSIESIKENKSITENCVNKFFDAHSLVALASNDAFKEYVTNKTSTDAYETSNKRELQNKGTNFKSDKHKLWPIPLEELSRRGGLTQNKGY